jgi:hypothetical protein
MKRDEQIAWILALIGIAGSGIAWAFAPLRFHYAWLAALYLLVAWPLGSMALLFTHALTGGRWGYAIRPALMAGVWTMPLVLLAIGPYIAFIGTLYPWLHPDFAQHLPNNWYLNGPFFAARGGVYIVLWLVLALLTLLALRPGRAWLVRIAPPGLAVLMLTVTFATIDTTLSLDPKFDSSIYGMVMAADFVLLALAIAVLASAPFIADRDMLADVAKVLLAVVMLWSWLAFMQLLIVWASDLEHDVPWYIARTAHGWGAAATAIAVCHFGIPFFLLLSPRVQRSPRMLMLIAALLIAIEIVYAWWLVLPAAPVGIGAVDLGPMLAIGGVAAGVALRVGRSSLVPEPQYG